MTADHSCPGCGGAQTTAFFEATGVPVDVGVQWEDRAAARACPRGDIRLALCRRCGLVFNDRFDPRRLSSERNYENSLDCSLTFQAYARTLAEQLIERYAVRHKTVVEIGCGRGAFLRLLCTLGDNRGIGFDPGYVPSDDPAVQADSEITIIPEVYSARHADRRADLLCCRHLLDHIPDPRSFVCELRGVLADDASVAYFEVPECREIFVEPYPWLIIYEHCLYFTRASLSGFFGACGYSVARTGTAYGDTFAFVEAHRNGPPPAPTRQDAAELAALVSAIEAFPGRHARIVERWRQRLRTLADRGARVVLWGAGARSIGFTSAVGAADWIPYVVDLNPRKWGRFLSGTGQEIVPPEALREYAPAAVIIMNSIYRDEIANRIQELGMSPELLCL